MAAPARQMLHVGMGPSPLREPLDRPRPRPVPPRPEPVQTPVRRRPARAARRRTAFLLFSGLVVGVLVVVLVSAQALVAQSSFKAEDAESRIEDLQREHGSLRLRRAELESPRRLQNEAARLGLVFPEEIHLIRLPATNGEVTVQQGGAGKAPASEAPADTGALEAAP